MIPLITILQTNMRRRHNQMKFNKMKQTTLYLQKIIKQKVIKDTYCLPKKQFRLVKTKNKYTTIFVDMKLVAIDIQKWVRRWLVQKVDDTATIYSSDEENFEIEETRYYDQMSNSLYEFFLRNIIDDPERLEQKINRFFSLE